MTRQPRRATDADVDALVRLINSAYQVERFFKSGDRTDAHDVRQRMAARGASWLVIDGTEPGEFDGAVYLALDGDHAHFAMLSVHPLRQKQGLGRALIGAVEQACIDAGCPVLELDIVNLRSELPAFYGPLGFVATGTLPFPDSERLTRDAHLIRMRKVLPISTGGPAR
jgi:GNAT superfamily N-acetyltransferase